MPTKHLKVNKMNISIRHIGKTCITLTCTTNDSIITEDICDLNGLVNEQFIEELQDVTNQLITHNENRKATLQILKTKLK